MEGFKHCCKNLARHNVSDRTRLTLFLLEAWYGAAPSTLELKAIATVMLMGFEGTIETHAGRIEWKHDDSQFGTGDLYFNTPR